MRTFFRIVISVSAIFTAAVTGTAFATPFTTYTTTIHLRDGKRVVCAVNEPRPKQPDAEQTLNTRDRLEAQIDATATLRKRPVNKDNYPSAATAPRVNCT